MKSIKIPNKTHRVLKELAQEKNITMGELVQYLVESGNSRCTVESHSTPQGSNQGQEPEATSSRHQDTVAVSGSGTPDTLLKIFSKLVEITEVDDDRERYQEWGDFLQTLPEKFQEIADFLFWVIWDNLMDNLKKTDDMISDMEWCPNCKHILYLHSGALGEAYHLECIKCGYYRDLQKPEFKKDTEREKLDLRQQEDQENNKA